MTAIEFLKQYRVYEDETIYNSASEIVGTISQLMEEYSSQKSQPMTIETKATDEPQNPVLSKGALPKPKCYNCKHASAAFKIAGKTYHQCNHTKHEAGFESGELSPWDTLQEFYNTCDTHEYHNP